MSERVRVAVIGGGRNGEHQVSLASAAAVAAALDRERYEVLALTIDAAGTWRDCGGRPLGLAGAAHVVHACDVVFPVVHGAHGEDGTLAALADLAGRPVVGSGLTAGALAMDKWVTKLVAGAVGVPTAPGVVVSSTAHLPACWTGPVVVKPVRAGSSQGVALVERPEELGAAVTAALRIDDRVLIEEVVVGREIDVAILERADGSRLLGPPLEIVTTGLFDFDTKYSGGADFRVPAPLEEVDLKALHEAALTVFDALGCRGLARVDFFLTAQGPVLNEVNTMPGLTEHSQAPKIFAAAGIPYADLLDELVRGAMR